MTHKSFFVIGMMAMSFPFVSCQSGDGPAVEPKKEQASQTASLSFVVTNYTQCSLDDVTRSQSEAIPLAHLALMVFDGDGKMVEDIRQNQGDEGYANFSLQLPYGEYTIVAMGYDGTRKMVAESPTRIYFDESYVPNCFLKSFSLTVDATTSSVQPLTLHRCVSCFTVICSEGIPAEMTAMEFVGEGGGAVLDATLSYCSSDDSRKGSIDCSKVGNRGEAKTFNIYTFLPDETSQMTFTLKAVDAKGNVLRTRTFVDVPMRINLRTVYEGNFFAGQDSGDDEKNPIVSEKEVSAQFSITLSDPDWEVERNQF